MKEEPPAEAAFLTEVAEAFSNYPDMRHRYVLASLALPIEMGIDFHKQIGVSRCEDGRILIEFQDRDEDSMLRMRHCDIRSINGECQAWSDELPK
jgi:hypothetical protein